MPKTSAKTATSTENTGAEDSPSSPTTTADTEPQPGLPPKKALTPTSTPRGITWSTRSGFHLQGSSSTEPLSGAAPQSNSRNDSPSQIKISVPQRSSSSLRSDPPSPC